MNKHEILSAAIEVYGPEAQTLMVMEEMAELQKELCKGQRGYDRRAQIAEEIADGQIMLDQMMILHGCEKEVQEWIEFKLRRLETRVFRETAAREQEANHEDENE